MPGICRGISRRCERDALELETMWLGEEDIEPDDGTPVPIEQPTEIKTLPLSEKDQDDRVRMALGLTRRPAPRCQSENPPGLLLLPGGRPEVPVQGKDRKRRFVADRPPIV